MEEDKQVKDLKGSIEELFKLSKEVQDIIYSDTNNRPQWTACSNRLETCYHKVNNPEGFREMFQSFHNRHYLEYTKENIFVADPDNDDDFSVNDDFFNSLQVYDQSGAIVSIKVANENKKGKSSFKIPVLKGPIMYYDYDDKRTMGINLPIGEIYRASINIFNKMEKEDRDDISTRTLPSRILLAFFNVINSSFTNEYKNYDIVIGNIKLLNDTISQIDDGTEEEKTSGPFGMLKNVFKKVLPTLTGGKNSLLPKDAEKMFRDIMDEKSGTLNNIGDIFSEVSSSIEKGANEAKEAGKNGAAVSITTMLDNISNTLKSETVVSKLGNIAEDLNTLTSTLAPPTASNLEKPVESGEADEQD